MIGPAAADRTEKSCGPAFERRSSSRKGPLRGGDCRRSPAAISCAAMVVPILVLIAMAGQPAPPPPPFTARCAACHGDQARGTAQAPGLVMNPRVAVLSVDQLRAYLERGNPGAGMPAFADIPADDLLTLARYLRQINQETIIPPPAAPAREIALGPPQPGDWRTYNGHESGNRYSPLTEISRANVASLKLKWVFPMPHFGLEVTPLAADGVLYVTGPNLVLALDAAPGRRSGPFHARRRLGSIGDSQLGTNRGVALHGDLVFFVTDNAHLLALDRTNGALRWETPMAPDPPSTEPRHHYGGTVAPLVVRDLVIAGVSGADSGMRGFVAAFDSATGRLVWRRWTVPRAGEAGIETWQGPEPVRGGGSTWLTGSYDPSSDTLYWATGNPWPGNDDRDRPGDNLYTNCVLALDAQTGALKWHYQFTPHDVDGSRRGRAERSGRYASTAASRRSCCSTPTATDSSMCSSAPAARCCWRRRSCVASTGHPRLAPTAGRSSRIRGAVPSMRRTGPQPRSRPDRLLLLPGVGGVRRQADRIPGSDGAAIPPRREHRDRRDRLGGAAARRGARQDLERRPGDGDGTAVLRSAEWRIRRRRSTRRPIALAVSDQRPHEGGDR